MTALLKFLSSGPPVPRVVLLPDHLFFVRVAPVAEGSTAADVATQVELALETLSPFPPAQLYYGHYWTAGSPHVLIYAAYRKRFTAEQTAEWATAEWVGPSFAALFGLQPGPATTYVIPTADGLTAVHWNSGPVPAQIATVPLAPDAAEWDRSQARDRLLRLAGGSRTVVDLRAPLTIEPSPDEKVFVFRSADFTSRVAVDAAADLDVRDKDELAALRRARSRDVLLWRTFGGCAAALGLLALGELALIGGQMYQQTRAATVAAQRPHVQRILTQHELTQRIEELSTKRLLPIDLIYLVNQKRVELFPKDGRGGILLRNVRITRAPGSGDYVVTFDAQTPNVGDVDAFRAALDTLPELANSVEVTLQVTRAGQTQFSFVLAFRPEAIRPRVQT